MATFLLSLVFLLLIVAAMSVGVLFGRKPIQGSCGGMNSLGVDTACEICGGNPKQCEESRASSTGSTIDNATGDTAALAYDAGLKNADPKNANSKKSS